VGQALDLGLAFVWEVLPAVQVPFKCRLGANCACVENAEWDLQWGGDSVYCQGVLCIEKTEEKSYMNHFHQDQHMENCGDDC
jgi:hypothetical protein